MIHEIKMLTLEEIKANAWNPNEMTSAAFERLVKEIDTTGFVSAIQVVPTNDGFYRIIGGEHRYWAAKKLNYKKVPAVVLADVMFQDEDLQKFLTVRLNMLSGDLDPDKFRVLFEEMKDKYGADSLKDLFGFTDDDKWAMIRKEVERGLKDAGMDKGEIKEALTKLDENKTIENLSQILNGIFSSNADVLQKTGMILFDFANAKAVHCNVEKDVFKYFDELEVNSKPEELTRKIEDLLMKLTEELV